MRTKYVAIAVVVGLVALGFGIAGAPAQTTSAASKTIYMSAVEYKGGTTVDKEVYPPADEPGTLPLAPIGGGYRLKEPDESGRWEVSTYRFEPGFFTVKKGQHTTMEIAGINGSRHDVDLINPRGVTKRSFVVTRGRLTRVTFSPRMAGIWTLICHTHEPGMISQVLVSE